MMAPPLYSGLDARRGEFRLLQIEPAPALGDVLVCSLQHARLPDKPAFEALSYTWGAPGILSEMQLNGQPVPIQENAAAALRRLRRTTGRRTLWVDAICINQADAREKEGQLGLMRSLYEQAAQVCVWLGEPADGTAIAINDLHDPLLTRPWWTRIWVVQEVVVGSVVIFMVGSDTFTWANIERSLARERKGLNALTGVPNASGATEVFGTVLNPELCSTQDENFRIMSRLRSLWATGTFRLSIYDLLFQLRHLQCTNPRDRVFACLGLATAGGQQLGIEPDYTSSTRDLPSWVPNWHAHTHRDAQPLLGWAADAPPRYAACGAMEMEESGAAVSYRADTDVLAVDGLLFDTVAALSPPWHPDASSSPALTRRGAPELAAWEALALDIDYACPYTTPESRAEAFWRTQIADCAGDPISSPHPQTQTLSPRDTGTGVGRVYMEAFADRTQAKSWASQQPPSLPPSPDQSSKPRPTDALAHLNVWQLAGMNVDSTHLHWDLHAELRRIEPGFDTAGSEHVYGTYLARIRAACAHRRLLVTRRGFMGLAPWNAAVGDRVCVLRGGRTMFLLREGGSGEKRHRLVGEAFVYGVMGGEAVTLAGEGGKERMRVLYLV
ncbi:heterokaryon incompatibility protein-domain-containing protein [Lasiosphaeria ovina]|uniref:Heterokaryon incompatibility protein-domain-containing protein n=1 Tax=Lasiosphaeria ovina TaxID=92902 RepID=A0AAE0N1C0_9PEZI|nr:heterokaryon incompatibility protein-domain-containing protein [Lasiosphaeria ovina]